jgi:hypothetical protein
MDLSGNEWHIGGGGARLYIGWPRYIYCQGHIKTAPPPYHIGYRVTATGGASLYWLAHLLYYMKKRKQKSILENRKRTFLKMSKMDFGKKVFEKGSLKMAFKA